MDLQIKKKKDKWYVEDRESGTTLNKKGLPSRSAAVKFMKQQMSAEKLSDAGDDLMPKSQMPMEMGAMGGKPPMPGMPTSMPMPPTDRMPMPMKGMM